MVLSLTLILFVISDCSIYKHCTESFIFSLVNPSDVGPTKLPLKANSSKKAIYCDGGCGPTFGAGPDLYISSESNANSDSRSKYLNSSYDCPPHVTPSTFLTASDNFTVNEIEVFVYQE